MNLAWPCNLTINRIWDTILLLTLKLEHKMTRRTASERQAEAALYRQRSEASSTTQMVSLSPAPMFSTSQCEYDKVRKVLKMPAGVLGMPLTFHVRSHHTGKIVKFVAVQPGDSLFDEDGWDGEQCIYRPTVAVPNVDYMVIYND